MANPAYYVALDCETGGLSADTADLLTCYISVVDENFKVQEELDLKLKPDGGRLPQADAGALKVNGINLHEHLANPETIAYSEAKPKIIAMLRKFLKKNGRYSNLRPMGYNLPFDIKFVQTYLLSFEEWDSIINYNQIDPKVVVNFLKDCGWLPPDLGTLVSVVKHFQIPMGTAHNAKVDTLATVEVYKKLIELMASKKNSGGQSMDLISLLEAE